MDDKAPRSKVISMNEDIGTLIRRGFETWRGNLNLAVPFVLMIVAIMVLGVAMVFAAMYPLTTTSPELLSTAGDLEDPEELVNLLQGASGLGLAAAIILIGILAMTLLASFFTAGAIGMAKEATVSGKTGLREMWASGRRHFISLFLAEVVMMVVILAGVLLLTLPFLSGLTGALEASEPELGTLVLWGVLLIAFSLLVSILLAMVPYALVVEGLGPVAAIKVGVGFFRSNKMEVFLMWVVVMAVSVAIQFLAAPFSGSEAASAVVSSLSGIVSILIISPLSTVWWTRLYMTRSGKMPEVGALQDEGVKYL